jgi:polyhydroxyalkanoate synthesis regulator phasin
MQDAWRAYLELAFGLTEASRRKAKQVAVELAGKGGATASQLQTLAEDLLSTSRKNRDGLARLVRYEVERALGALGLATADEVNELSGRIRELERQLRETGQSSAASTTTAGASSPAAASSAASKTIAKTPAKKTVAKKVVAKKATAAKKAASGKAAVPAAKTPPAKKATG